MRLPIRLAIEAPFREVLPVLTSALLDVGELWQQRVEGRVVTWSLEGSQYEDIPTQLALQPASFNEPNRSWLQIEFPDDQQRKEMLVVTMEELMRVLHHHGIVVSMVEEEPGAPTPTAPVVAGPPSDPPFAILASGASKPYAALTSLMTPLVKWYGLALHEWTTPPEEVDELYREVAAARMVIGAWESDIGRAALLQARAQGQPTLALAQESAALPAWLTRVVRYTGDRGLFVRALNRALSELLGVAERVLPARTDPTRLSAERRRIYRQVALNSQAPLAQRYHAARVLIESGDATKAAEVLGAIVVAPEAGSLAEAALAALGSLGEAARPVLWYLDACTTEPRRALEIARYLGRAGDAQTALFRLEWLARHAEEEAVRLAALDAMGEMGASALPAFLAFAREAEDPQLRLQAIHWLHARQEAAGQFLEPLTELALQEARPDIAGRAVGLLGALPEQEAHSALMLIAHHAPTSVARLAAAEVFYNRGENEVARAVLLRLAQGTDNLAAGAALDRLLHLSEEALEDTERLMANATLKSIRLRAAELLSQPQQPEMIQRAAARVFLTLERPALARPVLARLTRWAEDVDIRRWAAQELVLLGPDATDEVRSAFGEVTDPVAGQYLAEGLLSLSQLPMDRRHAAIWLANHSNLPRAVEVLGDLALSARVSGSDAVQATDDLNRYATRWAGAARVLATLASDSPHPAVRARALDLLLREHPSELPLSLLVDLAITGSIGSADRSPVMEQLAALAQPAASRIVASLTDEDTNTERRWNLLQLMNELPDRALTPALLQLSTHAPQNRIRYVAAEQLIARGHQQAGYAALASIAISAPDWVLRERALYELAQALPESALLLRSIVEQTRYEDTFHLARSLLVQRASLAERTNYVLDQLVMRWDAWVAGLPLGWLDRLFERRRQKQLPPPFPRKKRPSGGAKEEAEETI